MCLYMYSVVYFQTISLRQKPWKEGQPFCFSVDEAFWRMCKQQNSIQSTWPSDTDSSKHHLWNGFWQTVSNDSEQSASKHFRHVNLCVANRFRFAIDDEEFQGIIGRSNEVNELFSQIPEEFLPRFVTKIWASKTGKRFVEIQEETFNFQRRSIKEHQDKFDPECKWFC